MSLLRTLGTAAALLGLLVAYTLLTAQTTCTRQPDGSLVTVTSYWEGQFHHVTEGCPR